jgi:hypothetical protein
MQPDLVNAYKQAAIDEADPAAFKAPEPRLKSMNGGIKQQDVLDRARNVVFAKYPKAAKSRTNPPRHVKVLPRFNSFSDIDNMALYADDVGTPAPLRPTRTNKRKVADANLSSSHRSAKRMSKEPLSATVKEPVAQNSNSVEANGLSEDTPPPESAAAVRPRAGSDKENDMISRSGITTTAPLPWTATIPNRSPLPPVNRNVYRKMTLKDISAPTPKANKKIRLDVMTQDDTAMQLTSREGAIQTLRLHAERHHSTNKDTRAELSMQSSTQP